MTELQDARELMRAAYNNRYTWDRNFPGYSADITLKQGDRVYSGQVRIDANFKYQVSDVEDEQARKAIEGQAWEIAVHRVSRPFEESHKNNSFKLGATDDTGAVELLVEGQAAGDRYKVRDNIVTLVHRHIHGVVVTINTTGTIATEAGYLASHYDSVYHDAKTGEPKGGRSEFVDSYEKVGNYYILTSRVITTEEEGQTSTSEFAFSNVKLLEAVAV